MLVLILLAPLVHAVNVTHYAPRSTNINNLTYVVNGTTDAPGIYNTSTTPDSEYGTYNWCNMPHVRVNEYVTPSSNYTLEYVEIIQRHHKRTPYASNTFFKEDVEWSCDGSGPVYYAQRYVIRGVHWQASSNPINPWTDSVGPGFVGSTCQFPQITTEGLFDSFTHGVDLRQVYASRLGLTSELRTSPAQIRMSLSQITDIYLDLKQNSCLGVTNNVITSQVAGAELTSLEPSLSCTNAIKPGDEGVWQGHLAAAQSLYDKLDSVSGIASNDSASWHVSFDHYYDNLSAKQCHGKALPCSLNETDTCVTQEEANEVYRLGNWEYSYMYRDSLNSTKFSTLNYGAWLLELKDHLQTAMNASNGTKYFHNVAHDGSMASLLGFLQVAEMVWPGISSSSCTVTRTACISSAVLWGGQPMETSTPMGMLNMIPAETLIDYIDEMVGSGEELYVACMS
ncbi:phosphoglycerate mutase-like protein [Desarmillaria tabescens]|uniref:Phosphoglycerate mutase-like protein n=1 Tax=Armillaria tabescens TaxID=1929756 RepID=A0AA39J7T0_ARMTA|nr:phosphoglycerate mutase-like protein [Desarmillaria tabescens]KAK0437736.1 phosphoglycerate mutase-like protein [Desarmillaria tabescens]